MYIDLEKLKENKIKINNLIEKYEENSLNIYSELSSYYLYWQDGRAKKFQSKLDEEKKDCNTIIYYLKRIMFIYDLIVAVYEEYGCNVFFDYNNKDKMEMKFDDCVNTIQQIKIKYEKLLLTVQSKDKSLIENELKIIKDIF